MTAPTGSGLSSALRDLDRRLVLGVESVHQQMLKERRTELGRIAPEALALVDSLERYLSGGKLLRPRFCFFGGLAALAADPTQEQVLALARCGAAIELVQAAALMHDDVIDHSPTRRGRPALHIEQSAVHRDQHLAGSGDDFGTAVAIVLGDLTLSWSEQLFTGAVDDGAAAQVARSEFDDLRTEVMCGQYLDILHQAGGLGNGHRGADKEGAALQVIRWKTVPYTVLRPVRMGAALMGADEELLDLLSQWAIDVGTAFQLRDDLLSVVGDEQATGKPIGGDIVEGKRTVLLARTAAQVDDAGAALLDRTVGNPAADPEDVIAVQQLMVRTGAVVSVRQDVERLSKSAGALLAGEEKLGALGREGLSALAAHATDMSFLPG